MVYTVYIKKHCLYSQNAIALLKSRKITHQVHNVDSYGGLSKVISFLKKNGHISKSSTHKTVPMVFNHEGTFVGGYDKLLTTL